MKDIENEAALKIEIEILRSLWERIRELCSRRGWEVDEGLRLMLAAGIASLEADERQEALELEHDLTTLLRELSRLDSEYSAMKYRAFKLAEANRALQLKVSALKASEDSWKRWAEMMRRKLATHMEKDTQV